MAGRYQFTIPGRPGASIVNEGTITAHDAGFAALVAPGVRNSGTITADLGTVALASGNGFTLDFYGDKLITLGLGDAIASSVIDVATGLPLSQLVKNEGALRANGGRVELTAPAARQVVDSVINNTGVIEADTIGQHGGMIVLDAATSATKPAGASLQKVKVSGTLSVAGKNSGESGGRVQITGEDIELAGVSIDASGLSGGGTILIGGDISGGKPSSVRLTNPSAKLDSNAVPNATMVTVNAATTIDASAKESGNGGKVVVWSDQATDFQGSILAQGGTSRGNGGFVEVSGHDKLNFNGVVQLGAPNGLNGTLLLDPRDVTIGSTGAWVVTTAALEQALSQGDVIVTTDSPGTDAGDITVAESFAWSTGSVLTLSANRDIIVNDGVVITNTGTGNLSLRADNTGSGVGIVNFTGSGKVDFSGSTGTASIFYNPPSGYVFPLDYTPSLLTNPAVPNQFTAYMLVNNVNDLQATQQNLSGNYALGRDIDASATATWNGGAGFAPIAPNELHPFVGTFDGQDHKVLELTINRPSTDIVGLFAYVGPTAKIRNVSLVGGSVSGLSFVGPLAGYIQAGGEVSGSSAAVHANGQFAVGGLVGWNLGTIYQSNVTESVSGGSSGQYVGGLVGGNGGIISSSHAEGAVDGEVGVGGLAGWNNGAVSNSYATGSVHGADGVGGLVGLNLGGSLSESYSTGDVTSYAIVQSTGGVFTADIGGLVGFNGGTIVNTFATGNVTAESPALRVGGLVGDNENGTIEQSYAIGAVDGGIGGTNIGGLVGNNQPSGPIDQSYWDPQTTGQFDSDGGVPLTTAQFKSSLPSGFDAAIWGSDAAINNGYPYLLWQTQSPPSPPAPTILTGSLPGPPPDLTPPSVISFTPGFGATNVPVTVQPIVTFSEPLLASTVTPANFQLWNVPAGIQIADSVALSPDGTTVTITPAGPLDHGTAYFFIVSSGIKDLAGNSPFSPDPFLLGPPLGGVPSGAFTGFTTVAAPPPPPTLPTASTGPSTLAASLLPNSIGQTTFFTNAIDTRVAGSTPAQLPMDTRGAKAMQAVVESPVVKQEVAEFLLKLQVSAAAGPSAPIAEMTTDILLKLKEDWEANEEYKAGHYWMATAEWGKILLSIFVDVAGAGVLTYATDILSIATSAATIYVFTYLTS